MTGSSQGTSKDPKFSLLNYFENVVFPEIVNLTKPGAKFFGFQPVIQGDNAGPHNDSRFMNFVKEYCVAKGWLWEPQGPQMPHMNVLDLAVFPAMSRRHCALARSVNGVKVLNEDQIWENALSVFQELPSLKIANAFVLAKEIANKIMKAKGSNDFLSDAEGGLHARTREQFLPTNDGNTRIDGKVFKFGKIQDKP